MLMKAGMPGSVAESSGSFPHVRLRRLRSSPQIRNLFQETTVGLNDLIYPIFVEEEVDDFGPIESMPGVVRIPEKMLAREIEKFYRAGIRAVMLFGISHHKDELGSETWNPNGLLARMIRTAKQAVPEMVVISDTCFCEYTDHGHCGVIVEGHVHNDQTLQKYRQAGGECRGGGRRHDRAVRDDGRPGRRHPPGARRRGIRRHADHGLFQQVRLLLLRPVSRRRRMRLEGRSQRLPDEPAQRTRGAAGIAVRRGGRRGYPDGQAGAGLSRRHRAGQGRLAVAGGRLSGQRRIRDDQICREGRRDRREARRARDAGRDQAGRRRPDPDLFRFDIAREGF